MANIFKTTLKKDVIADIANNGTREIRFPITKFWATRLTDEYNLDDKTFVFKSYDSLELSAPSNKDTDAATYTFDFVRTIVEGDEFVVEFKDTEDEVKNCPNDDEKSVEIDSIVTEDVNDVQEETLLIAETTELEETEMPNDEVTDDDEVETIDVSNDNLFDSIKDWFDDEKVLENLYEDDNVFATNARQVIVLPKGRVLGFKKTLPVNNDVEVRVEFDMSDRIYFDATPDLDVFVEEVYRTLGAIRKNNFVFVWKRCTGIFMDDYGRIYFGIKYSTRKSIGFNRKYNVQ